MLRYLILVFVISTAFTQCISKRPIFIRRPISMPFSYYNEGRNKGRASNIIKPSLGFWDNEKDAKAWKLEEMYMFTHSKTLMSSYDLIYSGNPTGAIQILKASLVKPGKQVAYEYNNLAIAYLVNDEIREAKIAINQAGILIENRTILKNTRLITSFLQKDIKVYKGLKATKVKNSKDIKSTEKQKESNGTKE